MKKFPFTIIRKERLADIHHRNRTLSSVNDSIGDTLIAMPLIHELRVNFPAATIDVLAMWPGSKDRRHADRAGTLHPPA